MRRRAFCAFATIASLACTPQPTLPEDTFEPVRIGVVTSLSGGLGTDGPGWLDASELAALEANAAGGPLPGRRIELIVRDDETNTEDPERIRNIARELIETEGVVGIIGAAASSITLPIIDVTTEMRVPQLSCCSTSDTITATEANLVESDRFFFRTIAPDLLQSEVVTLAAQSAGTIDGALTCDRLAIMHLDDDYGTPFGMAIETATGAMTVIREPFIDGQPQYNEDVIAVRDALGDCTMAACCIALVAYPQSAAEIVRNWEALAGGQPVVWIGTDGIRAPGFVEEIGDPTLIDGFFGTSPITDANTPGYNAYVEQFRAVFGSNPIAYSSNQYDATALLILAIARAGSTDGDMIRDALREVASPPPRTGFIRAAHLVDGIREAREGVDIDYEGASGNVNFDANGDVVSPFEIWRYDMDGVTPCAGAVPLDVGGSFCRIRTVSAEEIMP